MRVSDRICEQIDEAIRMVALAQSIDYEVQIGIMPTNVPPGQGPENIVISQFFFFMRSPIIGQGDLVSVEILPLELTKNDQAIREMTTRCVNMLLDESRNAMKLPGANN